VFKHNYVKRKKALSEKTKRKISETLTGGKIGGQDSQINPKDGEELRSRVRSGDNFKYQALVDWWRNISSS